MAFLTPQGISAIVFIAVGLVSLILGLVFAYNLRRFGTSVSIVHAAELTYILVTLAFLILSAWALFNFYFTV